MSTEMTKTFVTFGQAHVHEFGDKVFDKDCVAVINHPVEVDGRMLAFQYFGGKFCFEYMEKEFSRHVDMGFFPRGLVEVNPL